jgi:hypothetical protein
MPKNAASKPTEEELKLIRIKRIENALNAAKARRLRAKRNDSISSLEEASSTQQSKASSVSKSPTNSFVTEIHQNYGSPQKGKPTSTTEPIPTTVTPTSTTVNDVQPVDVTVASGVYPEVAEWLSPTAKRKRLEVSKATVGRKTRRELRSQQKEKMLKRIKVGALVRKNLTRYGVGGDPSIVVHDVPTLGLVRRLRNSTGRFLVEFDNRMRLELRYEDFTYLTNTPEKRVLAKDDKGNMTVRKEREVILDSDITFLGVSDSPSRKSTYRRDYGVEQDTDEVEVTCVLGSVKNDEKER